jgi:hypothetical protein
MAFLGDEAVPLLPQFTPQNLANTAWGFSQLGARHAGMFAGIAAEAKARGLEGFNTQNLSDVAWAFSAAGHEVRRAAREGGARGGALGGALACPNSISVHCDAHSPNKPPAPPPPGPRPLFPHRRTPSCLI